MSPSGRSTRSESCRQRSAFWTKCIVICALSYPVCQAHAWRKSYAPHCALHLRNTIESDQSAQDPREHKSDDDTGSGHNPPTLSTVDGFLIHGSIVDGRVVSLIIPDGRLSHA